MRRTPRLIACFSVALAVAATAFAQAPATAPSSSSATIPLAKYIPKDGLVAYIEFQGTDAHAAAWGKTAASKILNDTTAGAMIEDVLRQAINGQLDKIAPGTAANRPDNVAILKHIARSGVVLGITSRPASPKGGVGTLVLRGALKPESKALFAQFLKGVNATGTKVTTVARPGNRTVAVITKADNSIQSYWWVENKEDLVITDDPDIVIASLDGSARSALDDTTHAEMIKAEDGFEPMGVAWCDIAFLSSGTSPLGPALAKADLKGVKRVGYRVGTRGQAIMDEIQVTAPAPRTGLLAAFDQPKFDVKTIPPMPDGVTEFTAFSIDPAKLYGTITTYARTASPDAEESIKSAEATVKSKTRLRLREDILGRLGPRMVAYRSPKAKSSSVLGGLSGGGFQVPKGALVIEMKDAKATTRMLDELMIFANKEIKSRMAKMTPPPAEGAEEPRIGTTKKSSSTAGMPEFKVVLNNPKTYTLNLPTQFAALTNARPTIAVGKKHLAIGTMPDAAREALTAETKGSSKGLSADATRAVEGMPSGLMMLRVSDPRETLPDNLANLPATIQSLLNPTPPGAMVGAAAPPNAPGLIGPRGRPGGPGGPGGANAPKLSALGGGEPPPGAPGAPQAPPGAPGSPSVAPVTIQVDPAKIPKPETIRPLLFPGSSAVVVDDQGIRIVSRYAFPDLGGTFGINEKLQAVMGTMKGGGLPGMPPPTAPGGAPNAAQKKGGGPAGAIAD